MIVVGYLRVSRHRDGSVSLAAQERTIWLWAELHGHDVDAVYADDGASGARADRPGLEAALRDVRAGQAEALVVAKLDRASRSLFHFAGLVDEARRDGWALVALDIGLDTSTPGGELVANVLAAVAQWERRQIADRLHAGRREKARQGGYVGGPRPYADADVITRIGILRRQGLTWQRIADALNADGIPTSLRGRWHGASVRRIASRAAA